MNLSMHSPRFWYRLAIVFCFLSFGIWELLDPAYWVAYVPELGPLTIDPGILVFVHGLILTVVGIGMMTSHFLRLSTLLAVLLLLEICLTIVFTIGWGDILIRDLALLLFSVGFFRETQAKL